MQFINGCLLILAGTVAGFDTSDDGADATSADAAEVAILKKLKEIGITATKEDGALTVALPTALETDATLEKLKGLTRLRCLYLGGTKVTGAGFVHLKDMRHLICLNLGKNINEAELIHLQKLDNLALLTLRGARITSAGVQRLTLIPKLTILDLRDTPVVDAGLEHLQKMPNLGRLLIGGTKVTDEGVERLRKAMPRVLISTSTQSYQ